MNYDIIGDIHGHAAALKALLRDLGYRETGGAWRHPSRQAVFVGDFIDRGPEQLATVDLVRRMVDAGSALAVLGNHEFNAIAWFLPDPDVPGEFLRKHQSRGDKNFHQHEVFLRAVEGSSKHRELIDWFLSLPVYLELGEIRVVHACWHERFINYLAPYLTPDRKLTADLMIPASRQPDDEADRDSPEPSVFKALDTLLKGVEIPLPPSCHYCDKDGISRTRTRMRWWDKDAVDYRRAAMLPEAESVNLPDDFVPAHVRIGHDGGKPVFVGHYWLTGTPSILSDKVACVDYSVAKDGKLVAYRYEGESVLDPRQFHWLGRPRYQK